MPVLSRALKRCRWSKTTMYMVSQDAPHPRLVSHTPQETGGPHSGGCPPDVWVVTIHDWQEWPHPMFGCVHFGRQRCQGWVHCLLGGFEEDLSPWIPRWQGSSALYQGVPPGFLHTHVRCAHPPHPHPAANRVSDTKNSGVGHLENLTRQSPLGITCHT